MARPTGEDPSKPGGQPPKTPEEQRRELEEQRRRQSAMLSCNLPSYASGTPTMTRGTPAVATPPLASATTPPTGPRPFNPNDEMMEQMRLAQEEEKRKSASATRTAPAATATATSSSGYESFPRYEDLSFEEMMDEYRRMGGEPEPEPETGLGQGYGQSQTLGSSYGLPRQRQDPSYGFVSLRPSATSTATSTAPPSTPPRRTGAASSTATSTAPLRQFQTQSTPPRTAAASTAASSPSSWYRQSSFRPSTSLSQRQLPSQTPAPPVDDPNLTDEDRQARELYNRLRTDLAMDRRNPVRRVENLFPDVHQDPFAQEDPHTRGVSIGGTRLGKMLADQQRQLVARQRAEKLGRKSVKRDKLSEAERKWTKKHFQAFGAFGTRARQRQELPEQEVPGLIRSMSEMDLSSIGRDQAAQPRPSFGLRRSQSMSDLRSAEPRRDFTMTDPTDPRMGTGQRRFHPTKLQLPETDTEFGSMIPEHQRRGLPRLVKRLMPSYIEPGCERAVGSRLHKTSDFGIQEKSERLVKSRMSDLGSQARKPVSEFGRWQRRRDLERRAETPMAVGSLEQALPSHRHAIPEVSDEAERTGDIGAIIGQAAPSPTRFRSTPGQTPPRRSTPSATASKPPEDEGSGKMKDTWL